MAIAIIIISMIVLFSVCAIIIAVALAIYRSKSSVEYPHEQVYELFKRSYGSSTSDAVGKVAIVTGSTSGIGRDVAAKLYKYGATVVVAARNEKKALGVMEGIIAESPASKGGLDFHLLDTSDLDSVKVFASNVLEKYPRVDYLVNNAGIHYQSMPGQPVFNSGVSITSKQGYDTLFATNYMGHFLLTELMLPYVTEKIVNIASTYHFEADGTTLQPTTAAAGGSSIDRSVVDAANGTNRNAAHKLRAYGVSKLAQVLHTHELQRRLNSAAADGKPVTTARVVSVCPGWVNTAIMGPESNPVAQFVRMNAYPHLAGVLAPMRALFDDSLKGGEFVTNQKVPLQSMPWFDALLRVATSNGLREVLVNGLAVIMLLGQSWTYGMHITTPSTVSQNEKLAAALFDWTRNELVTRGYI